MRFHQPGVAPEGAWFDDAPAEAAKEVNRLVERALRELSEALGTALDLVARREARESEEREREFEQFLTRIAGVLLVPTLVASCYGANTALPGGIRGRAS
jgi:Mg2+ and Co2+ transporter CorA